MTQQTASLKSAAPAASQETPDRIERVMDLAAPLSRVWKALTDYRQFNAWFGIAFAEPFAQGRRVTGRITMKGLEHVVLAIDIQAIEPEHYFAWKWHPACIDPSTDYSVEKPTLVEFRLAETAGGTRLTVTETGFSHLPVSRRAEAFRMNSGGWISQMAKFEAYVTAADAA